MSGFDKKTEVSRLDFDFAPVASLALVLRNILDNRDCGVSHTWEEICFKLEKKILQNLDIELTSTGAGAARHLDHNCSTESDYIRNYMLQIKWSRIFKNITLFLSIWRFGIFPCLKIKVSSCSISNRASMLFAF